ncbi:hypothetical protein [Fusobacterium sp. PH5-44]|uniref:hypothetical protein n=1 Tax=unclassified Fusobacterium TaxID=2648384 RepID=UPI003D1F3723
MGFLDKLMGLGGSKSEGKKEEIRNIFNSKVENGGDYEVIAAMNMVTTKKLLKEIRTYYNYIIGYRSGEDPEMVIISTDAELSEFDKPIYCKKSECERAKYLEQTGSFTVSCPALGGDPFNFFIIASTAWGGYVIDVSYVDEFTPFVEFFKKSFSK